MKLVHGIYRIRSVATILAVASLKPSSTPQASLKSFSLLFLLSFTLKVARRPLGARDVAADTDAADGPHGLGMQCHCPICSLKFRFLQF